jgi:hypothetical protein
MLKFTRGCVVVLLLMLAPRAVGQFGLPAEITQSTAALTDAQKSQIDQHIAAQMAKVESQDADKVRQAQEIMSGRRALIEPLTSQASVPFRLAYAERLEPRLRTLLQNGNEMQKVNALVISAELGATRSLGLIAMGRTSETPSIRFQAAAATRRLLDSLANVQSRAINDDDLRRLLTDTGNALTTEKDPQVTAGQIAALAAGLGLQSVRTHAADELSDAARGMACRQKGDPLHPRVMEAISAAMGVMRDQMLNAGTNVPGALSKTSAGVSAACLSHTQQVISGQKLPPARSEALAGRPEYADFAGLASGALQLCGRVSVPPVAVPPHALVEDIKANTTQKDAGAVKNINELIAAAASGFKVNPDPCK